MSWLMNFPSQNFSMASLISCQQSDGECLGVAMGLVGKAHAEFAKEATRNKLIYELHLQG